MSTNRVIAREAIQTLSLYLRHLKPKGMEIQQIMATYGSLKEWVSEAESRVANRIVLHIRPDAGGSFEVIKGQKRHLVGLRKLKIIFAENLPGGRKRSYELELHKKKVGGIEKFCFGGSNEEGTRSCRLLDKMAEKMANKKETLIARILDLLALEDVSTVHWTDFEEAALELWARVSPHKAPGYCPEGMKNYLWKLYLDRTLRLESEPGDDGLTDALVMDYKDLGIEHIFFPEKVDADGKLKFSGTLNSSDKLIEAIGERTFDEIASFIMNAYCCNHWVPVSLVDPAEREELEDRMFWDLTNFVKFSKETVGADPRYAWFVVIGYDDRANLKFETGSALLDFADNHKRDFYDAARKAKADEAKARRKTQHRAKKPEEKK